MSSRTTPRLLPAILVLVLIHATALLAGFFGPYEPAEQDRSRPSESPSSIDLHGADGRVGLFVADPGDIATPTAPLQFLVTRDDRVRLLGVDPPTRLNLLGTDSLGRDVFSRLLWGGRVSLLAGLVATFLSIALGTTLGIVAGFYGGRIDALLMRVADLFLALPLLYLLLAIRALLPLSISTTTAFLLLIGVLGLAGWARPARLVRGVALAARERDFVLAARSLGASDIHILFRHVLPQTRSVVLTQAALLAPQYVLAEVALSYFGVGVSEPTPSWGTMLAEGASFAALSVPHWWLLSPALLLVATFVAYHSLARSLDGGSHG